MNNKNKKKKKGGGVWAVIVAAIILFNMLDEIDTRDLRTLFWRLQHADPQIFIAILAVIVSLLVVIVSISVRKRIGKAEDRPVRRSPSPAEQHSHDRIQGYTGSENGYTHWKKQLDGFLEAGLIDRREYQALLERRKDNY